MNGLMRIMTNGGGASKSRAIRNQHVPMPAQRGWGEASGDLPAKLAIETRRADSRGANSTHRTLEARIRFRFVPMAIVNAGEELWTSAGLPVDGLRVRLHRFRKSHQVIAVGSDASCQRVLAHCVRNPSSYLNS